MCHTGVTSLGLTATLIEHFYLYFSFNTCVLFYNYMDIIALLFYLSLYFSGVY